MWVFDRCRNMKHGGLKKLEWGIPYFWVGVKSPPFPTGQQPQPVRGENMSIMNKMGFHLNCVLKVFHFISHPPLELLTARCSLVDSDRLRQGSRFPGPPCPRWLPGWHRTWHELSQQRVLFTKWRTKNNQKATGVKNKLLCKETVLELGQTHQGNQLIMLNFLTYRFVLIASKPCWS